MTQDQRNILLDSEWGNMERWSTAKTVPSKQFNQWRDFVVDAHLFWEIKPLACNEFPSFLRQARFDGFRLIHLTSAFGGVSGTRSRSEITKDDDEFYNLIYVAEGSLGLDFGTHKILLDRGSFAMWDTSRSMRFEINEKLREISFSVPKKRLEDALPGIEYFCGRLMRSTPGISKLFIEYILALETNFGELSSREAGEAIDASTEMMVAALLSKAELPLDHASQRQLNHVMDSIILQIDNPRLTTRQIAHNVGISERQLFRLFTSVGTTPAAWVRKKRLESCRRDLLSCTSAHLSIFEVAAKWGFIDSSVFSRSFRHEFGVSPRQVRSTARFG